MTQINKPLFYGLHLAKREVQAEMHQLSEQAQETYTDFRDNSKKNKAKVKETVSDFITNFSVLWPGGQHQLQTDITMDQADEVVGIQQEGSTGSPLRDYFINQRQLRRH